MDWLARLRERQKLLVTGILLVSLAAFAVSLQRNPISFDAFWHLKTGQDWIVNGLNPRVDHYSFTYNGAAVRNQPLAFQVLLHYAVAFFGIFGGFMAVKTIAQTLTLGATFLFLKSVNARALLVAIVIPCVVVLLQTRSFTRPETISYAFSVVAMLLYFRARDTVSVSTMIPIVVLMLIWTNYHSSIIGYVIFSGLFVDCAVRQFRDRERPGTWIRWAAWGFVVLLVGFLNHDGLHPVIEAIRFPPEWRSRIFEYFAPWPYIKKSPALPILSIVAVITPLLALLQRKFGLLLVWAVLCYTAATTQRMVAPAGVVIVVMMAGLLAARDYPHRPFKESPRGVMINVVSWFLVAIPALYANLVLALNILEENRSTYTRYPEALTRYMLEGNIDGPIFNDYGIGGFLIYRLAPQNLVYIDGRTGVLYPVSHLLKFEAIQRSPELLVEESNRYGFELVVLPFKQNMHDLVSGTGQFVLDYVDAGYALYRKQGGRFPVHSQLLARPACWSNEVAARLTAERELINQSLPYYSALKAYSDFVAGYIGAAEKQAYFDRSFESGKWTDFIRRFVAFRVFESGDNHLARVLLGGIEEKVTVDYLASAVAMLRAGDDDLALQIMRIQADKEPGLASPSELEVILQTWETLDQRVDLNDQELQFVELTRKKLRDSGRALEGRALEPGPALFCESAER